MLVGASFERKLELFGNPNRILFEHFEGFALDALQIGDIFSSRLIRQICPTDTLKSSASIRLPEQTPRSPNESLAICSLPKGRA